MILLLMVIVIAQSLDYMNDNYINNKVHQKVARANGVEVSEVDRIREFVSKTMRKVIENNDPKISMKLDYIGNLVSLPKQREAIIKKQEKKNNGRFVISKGRGSNSESPVLTDRDNT